MTLIPECFLRLKQFDKAAEAATASLAADPLFVKSWVRRAKARVALSQASEARADITKALDLEPKNAAALELQASLDSGLIYPPQSQILDASLRTAAKIAAYIFDQGLARVAKPADIDAHIRGMAYKPMDA